MPCGIYKHPTGEKASRWTGGKVKYVCKKCNKIRFAFPSQVKTYCSRRCASLGKSKHTTPHTEESKRKISEARKLNHTKTEFKKGHKYLGGGQGWFKKGQKPKNWQGGKRTLSQIIKDDVRWKRWRKAVFKRDNYTCQKCGAHGCYIHPHHIIHKVKAVDLAFKINNGITLCVPCHKEIHRSAKNIRTLR